MKQTKQEKIFAISGMLSYTLVVFLNAFTDLGHKIIIQNSVFKVYDGEMQVMLTAIVNALILLPFILLFSPSGFLADRFAKSKIMQYSALFAVVITLLITYSYYHGMFLFAFALTFLLALQSAIYSPAKYGYIKELVGVKHLSAGNAVVQATTTVAILGGIIVYTVLFESYYDASLTTTSEVIHASAPLGWLLVIGSVIEFLLALRLPNRQLESSKRTFQLKRYIKGTYLRKNLKTMTRKKEVLYAIIALGLFWSISQVVLAIFGEYAKNTVGVSNTIYVQGVMALAGIGIVLGSITAAKLSKDRINTNLSVLGAVSITAIVFFVPSVYSMAIIAAMFIALGFFAGFILVPLNAQIQKLTPNVHLGTVLAANNFVQNIFMFTFLILTTIFAYFGINTIMLFYFMGFVGIWLVVVLLRAYAVDLFWFVAEFILSLRYALHVTGREHLQDNKAILLLGNHVSWLDWAFLQLAVGKERKVNFLMDKEIHNHQLLKPFMQKGEVIPLSPKGFKDAMQEASKRLQEGRIVAIFPEGGITYDGKLGKFHRGYELIAKGYDGVIVPFCIKGVFGSIFARYKDGVKPPLWQRIKIEVQFCESVPKTTDAQRLYDKLKEICEAQ
ncbi:MAG: MFS transporter [Epsilonproteobacteria bacterium]|nr:MFS transporter [Campylobacterota bacterium]